MQLIRATDITPWVQELESEQPIAHRVCLLHLGTVEASSFQETCFSTAQRVWNKKTVRMHPDNVEKRVLLRHNKDWVKLARRDYVANKSCPSTKL